MKQLPSDPNRRMLELAEAILKVNVGQALANEFNSDSRLRLLFGMTGRSTRSQIQRRTHLDNATIAKTWADWYSRGLVGKRGRAYHKLWEE